MTSVCPNCKSTNIPGSVFCIECGAQLLHSDALVTQNISTAQVHEALANQNNQPQVSPQVEVTAWASLHLIDTGQMLPLVDRNEFTLGRISDGQPIMPDIDLSAYQAYAGGFPCRHRGPRLCQWNIPEWQAFGSQRRAEHQSWRHYFAWKT
jgi:hypothetical protein